jgi:hypothetical protein
MNIIDGVPIDLQAFTATLRGMTHELNSLPDIGPTVDIVTVEREDGLYAVIFAKRTYKIERGNC